jgi:hypothetical protein
MVARKGGLRYVEEVKWAVVAEVNRLMVEDSKGLSLLLLLPCRPAAQIMSLCVPVSYF